MFPAVAYCSTWVPMNCCIIDPARYRLQATDDISHFSVCIITEFHSNAVTSVKLRYRWRLVKRRTLKMVQLVRSRQSATFLGNRSWWRSFQERIYCYIFYNLRKNAAWLHRYIYQTENMSRKWRQMFMVMPCDRPMRCWIDVSYCHVVGSQFQSPRPPHWYPPGQR